MNKWIAGLFAAALCASPAIADIGAPAPTAKDLEKVVDEVNFVETAKSGIVLSGYVDVGYTYNFAGGSAIGVRPAADRVPNGDFNLNAIKLTLEKPLSDANEFQAGFRVDLMYGEDVSSVAFGTGTGATAGSSNDFFVQQGYVQIRAPYGNGVDIKAGKFVTWLGYEVIERPSNLNITYGNLFQNMIPLGHVGVSAEYAINDIIDDIGFAVVNGFNSDTNNGFNGTDDGYGIMAKVNVTNPGGNANLYQAVYYSWDSAYEVFGGTDRGSVVIYDVVGNWVPKFANDKLLLGFNIDLGNAENNAIGAPTTNSSWWGAALYAKYQFTDIFSLATRTDYIHNTGVAAKKFGAGGNNSDENLWSWTATAGFDLLENLLVRAEYRLDWGNDTTVTTGGATGDVAHTVALQAVYTF